MSFWREWDIRKGSLVIAYLNLLFYILLMCGILYVYIMQLGNEQLSYYEIPIIGALTLNCFYLLLTCFLIFGITKNKPNYILPWLLLKFLGLILFSIIAFVLWGNTILSICKEGLYNLIILVVVAPFIIVLAWYFFMVVYRLHKSLTVEPSHKRFYEASLHRSTTKENEF